MLCILILKLTSVFETNHDKGLGFIYFSQEVGVSSWVIMDYSTISNKTNVTEMEDLTNGELTERYYLLQKQYEKLSSSYESTKQELHDVRRNFHTAIDVQSHLTVELENLQAEEQKSRSELMSRLTSLQEDCSALREERRQTQESYTSELTRLRTEINRLKEENTLKQSCESPERTNTAELDELRIALHAALTEAEQLKLLLEASRTEVASWEKRGATLVEEMQQMKENVELRREELRAANEREAVALAELAEVRAMLHQCTNPQDEQPHGKVLLVEVLAYLHGTLINHMKHYFSCLNKIIGSRCQVCFFMA